MNNQEIEVKFYIKDLAAVERRLIELGAILAQARTYEINLRFDTSNGDLTRAFRVLRLRQDTVARLTYKGPAQFQDGVRTRQEIEFEVSDFQAARAFLLALGYKISMIYEKYRAEYKYGGNKIALDQLPYGNFVEIEGPDSTAIQAASQSLGFDWHASVPESYSILFDRLRSQMNLGFRDLIFENFGGMEISAADLNVRPADGLTN